MTWRLRALMKSRGALLAGAAVAVLWVVLFAPLGHDFVHEFRGMSLLGELLAVPLVVMLLALIAQLMLDGRQSLDRERRLVRTAAALREATAQLEKLAATDPLTGIWNRRAFFEAFGIEFRRAQRYRRNLSVLMIDLDNFKLANDLGGHAYGDYVLAATAKLIRENLRESDMVGRYGGEEFAVVLPETDAEHAAPVAEKMRAAIEAFAFRRPRSPEHREAPDRFTVSVGSAALSPENREDLDSLLSRADIALQGGEARREESRAPARLRRDQRGPAACPGHAVAG